MSQASRMRARARDIAQAKARPGKSRLKWIGAAVILAIAATVFYLKPEKPVDRSTETPEMQVRRLKKRFAGDAEAALKVKIEVEGENYIRNRLRVGLWWLSDRPVVASAETFLELGLRKREVLDLLEKYRHVSPLAEDIAAAFTDFRTAILDNDKMYYYDADADWDKPLPDCSICFIPVNVLNNLEHAHKAPMSVMWQTDVRSMLIPAYRFPPELYAGILFHEFGHGLLHSKRNLPDPIDKFHAAEETEMHTLGMTVLNEASGGKLFAAVDRVLDRSAPHDFKEAVAALTAEDMRVFDKTLGVGDGYMEAQLLNSVYYLIAGFRTIDRQHGSFEDKARGYIWITSWTTRDGTDGF